MLSLYGLGPGAAGIGLQCGCVTRRLASEAHSPVTYRAKEYRAGDAGEARSLSDREAALQEVVSACSPIEQPGCRERRDRNRGGQ
jgi:hypothetical protein